MPVHHVCLLTLQSCARSIICSQTGVGYCLSAIALIGSRRRHVPTDVQGWVHTQQSIAAISDDTAVRLEFLLCLWFEIIQQTIFALLMLQPRA